MILKKISRFVFQLLFVLVTLEILLRIIYYQRTSKEAFALAHAVIRIDGKFNRFKQNRQGVNFGIGRPDSSAEVNKMIAQEVTKSNLFEYTPWTDYRNIDFSGKYINTNGYIRRSDPAQFINPQSIDTLTINFFGGSTMYGLNATDRETIASAFVNLYKSEYPEGRSIKVSNYGICAYHSYNELMLLSHLIYSGKKPRITIFLDGLNDFLIVEAVRKRLPYFYYRLKIGSQRIVNEKEFYKVLDSTQSLFEIPNNIPETVDTLMEIFLTNIKHLQTLCKSNDIESYFFIQPNPYYNYPNRLKDPLCDKEENAIIKTAYPLLEKKIAGIDNCWFLGNMLEHEKGYPFIDRFHYSPAMSGKIAREILKVVGEKINGHGGADGG